MPDTRRRLRRAGHDKYDETADAVVPMTVRAKGFEFGSFSPGGGNFPKA